MLYADIPEKYKEQITSLMSYDNVSELLRVNRIFVVDNNDWKYIGRQSERALEDSL